MKTAVLDSLAIGHDEPFAILPRRLGAIRLALKASLQTADAADEIRCLLRFIVAFDGSLRSPSAARSLRTVLRGDPDALQIVRTQLSYVQSSASSPAMAEAFVPPRPLYQHLSFV
ncbi:MAG: hypothetical protein AAFN74_03295 [Myxococcota bacterium]